MHKKTFDLDNEGQVAMVNFMANINIYRIRNGAFSPTLIDFKIFIFPISRQSRHAWQIPDFLSDGNSNGCIFQPMLAKIAG